MVTYLFIKVFINNGYTLVTYVSRWIHTGDICQQKTNNEDLKHILLTVISRKTFFMLKSGSSMVEILSVVEKFKHEIDFIKIVKLNRYRQTHVIDEGLKHFNL